MLRKEYPLLCAPKKPRLKRDKKKLFVLTPKTFSSKRKKDFGVPDITPKNLSTLGYKGALTRWSTTFFTSYPIPRRERSFRGTPPRKDNPLTPKEYGKNLYPIFRKNFPLYQGSIPSKSFSRKSFSKGVSRKDKRSFSYLFGEYPLPKLFEGILPSY